MFGINKNVKNATTTTGFKGKARKLVLALGGLGLAGVLMGAAPAMAHDVVQVGVEPGIVVGYHHHRIWVPAHYELRTYYFHGRPVTEQVFVPGHFIWR
jgi:hypothetical protein